MNVCIKLVLDVPKKDIDQFRAACWAARQHITAAWITTHAIRGLVVGIEKQKSRRKPNARGGIASLGRGE